MRLPSGTTVAVAGCAVLATAAVMAAAPDTDRATAQSGVTLSAQQLLINQRVSQASVRRSNRALNYLAPVRTADGDAADDGTDGVMPPGGEGWTDAQLADGSVGSSEMKDQAVTGSKLADGAVGTGALADAGVTEGKLAPGVAERFALWAVVSPAGALVRDRGATAVTVIAATYFYRVDFDRPVRDCAYTASVGGPGQAYIGPGEVSTYSHPVLPQSVVVVTHNSAGAGLARGFHLTVHC